MLWYIMDLHAHIRKYKTEDKPLLLEIMKSNVPHYFAESEIVDYSRYLDLETEKYFVVCIENSIVGAGGINYQENHTRGMISWDLIHPDYQRKGFGRELLTYRLLLLQSDSRIREIRVRTSQFVYQFYQKNGFKLKNVIKDYWAKGMDLYDMKYLKNNTSLKNKIP